MASIAAQNVAKEVLEKVRKGERPVLGKIIPKHGYGPSIATHPNKVTNTESYKKVMRPIIAQLEEERQAILNRMPAVRDKAKYRDLSDGLDKTTKAIQLLTGGATENINVRPLATLDELRQDNSN